MQAVDENGFITELGDEMCRFPLEPSYSKSLISALLMDVCQDDMITLVAMLSSENIWSKPSKINKEEEFKIYEKKRFEFLDADGDHHSLIKIYNRWKKNKYSD
jgi:ATP-dependent RNA helicase DHX8/PRP22